MTEEKIVLFRERVQPQIRDYLKAAHIELDEDEFLTTCPICGDTAGIMCFAPRTSIKATI